MKQTIQPRYQWTFLQNFRQFLNKTKYEKKKKKKKKKEKKRKKRSKKTLEQNVLYKMKCSQSIIKGEIGSQILRSSFSMS